MLEVTQQHALVGDRVNGLLVDDFDLQHFLDGELFLGFLMFSAPHLPEPSLAQNVLKVVLILRAVRLVMVELDLAEL